MTRFSFWGLFAVFFAMLAAYWLWMRREDRREEEVEAGNAAPPADRPPSATHEAGGERNAGQANGAGR